MSEIKMTPKARIHSIAFNSAEEQQYLMYKEYAERVGRENGLVIHITYSDYLHDCMRSFWSIYKATIEKGKK